MRLLSCNSQWPNVQSAKRDTQLRRRWMEETWNQRMEWKEHNTRRRRSEQKKNKWNTCAWAYEKSIFTEFCDVNRLKSIRSVLFIYGHHYTGLDAAHFRIAINYVCSIVSMSLSFSLPLLSCIGRDSASLAVCQWSLILQVFVEIIFRKREPRQHVRPRNSNFIANFARLFCFELMISIAYLTGV